VLTPTARPGDVVEALAVPDTAALDVRALFAAPAAR